MLTASFAGALALCAAVGTTPYHLDPALDGVMTVGMLTFVAVEEGLVKPTLSGGRTCPLIAGGDYCDKAKLNALDRSVVGNNSASWRLVSNVGQYSAMALPVALTSLDAWLSGSSTPFADFGTETLVMGEAVTIAMLTTELVKLSVRRARPAQYVPGTNANSVEQQVSFLSGHTTATASATTAYATTFWLKHPDSPARFVVVGGAVLLTGFVGYARVAGGMHFYSDVFAGAVVGGVIGWFVPYWHRAESFPSVSFQVLPGGGAVAWHAEF